MLDASSAREERPMSERKYRQRGYQDDDRGSERKPPPRENKPRNDRPRARDEMRTPNFPGFVEAMRCARCGRPYSGGSEASCQGCGVALRSCVQCSFFDPGAHFQCMQPVPALIAVKDAANDCTFFEPRVRVERQTGSTSPASARSAFDDLFKF
jgi:hypothetical protein